VADAINRTQLLELPGPEYEFQAKIKGKFPEGRSTIVPRKLLLRKGARVMTLKIQGNLEMETWEP